MLGEHRIVKVAAITGCWKHQSVRRMFHTDLKVMLKVTSNVRRYHHGMHPTRLGGVDTAASVVRNRAAYSDYLTRVVDVFAA